MSEQIGQIQTAKGPITLTSFWGGDKRGKCLIISTPSPFDEENTQYARHIELTIPELILMLPQLKVWVDDQIKPNPRGWEAV